MIIYSQLAKADLADIWNYGFEQWSREQADRYYIALIEAVSLLASGAKRGRLTAHHNGFIGIIIARILSFINLAIKNCV